MADIEMKDATQDDKPEPKEIYNEFKIIAPTIDRLVILKDLKELDNQYRYINKYRKEFELADFIFLNENFIKPNYNFKTFDRINNDNQIFDNFKFSQNLIDKIKQSPQMFGFVFIILLTKLIDEQKFDEAFDATNFLISYFKSKDTLTLKFLKAKTYYYLSFITEKLGNEDSIIKQLLDEYRISCIEEDKISEVTLINCIIRYYLNKNNIVQARSFLSKVTFAENVSTHEDARFLFYKGKIEAIQLNYSEAYKHLTTSFRKAPEKTATGFKTLVNKYLIIVQLLMGELPDMKSLMKTNQITDYKIYKPYLELLKVVRQGNLQKFKDVLVLYGNDFKMDGTFNVIQRIREVVIKAGLKKINVSYSRISIRDITEKLKLDNEQEAEYIIAKAIRDGVFLATINHEEGYVQSKEIKDIYTTFEPQRSYQTRIEFLNKILNDAKKGMKYSEEEEAAKKALKDTELEEEEGMDTSFHDFY